MPYQSYIKIRLPRMVILMHAPCIPCHGSLYIINNYFHTENCGPPSVPIGGYIFPYTNTLEGEVVTYSVSNQLSIDTDYRPPIRAREATSEYGRLQ